ncbi:MAG: P1 family peptidase [Vampirovibrionales bacterium]|nr:P1 family peptidase [Vampirovibrionales bacterium]
MIFTPPPIYPEPAPRAGQKLDQSLQLARLKTSGSNTPDVIDVRVKPSEQALQPGTSFKPLRLLLPQWRFNPGPYNAITDVPGVRVGHATVKQDSPHTLRTGVTAILPHNGNLARVGLWAAGSNLNGNGEMTGLAPLETFGVLNTPILLTNTFSVGAVHQGVHKYFQTRYPGQWGGQLPIVGECYDGFFNTIDDLSAVTPQDAVAAIESARGGPVEQGRVGAGTGMRSFELHAGIGSASRKVMVDGKWYTIGVLLNANHSRLDVMNPFIRNALEKRYGSLETLRQKDSLDRAISSDKAKAEVSVQTKAPSFRPNPRSRQGSIITVIATDLPLNPTQLKQLANRSALGVGAMGSTMDTTSGDFVVAFSTANPFTLGENSGALLTSQTVHPDLLSPVYRATVEAVTEAQINALQASHSNLPAPPILNDNVP